MVLLNVCHWAADFTHLSTDWMLNAKKYGKPLYPIFVHALVHAILFFLTTWALFDLSSALFAGWFQLVTHFLIDLLKGRLNGIFKGLLNPENKFHWWIFGADQLLHHLVILIIVYSCAIA